MSLSVSLQSLVDYDPGRVKETLHCLLEPLGGIENFVKPGQKVLIKPNLLAGKSPEKAVTTHPEIVRQVILLIQSTGAVVTVGDSPGLGKPESVARKCGVYQVIEETGARFADLRNPYRSNSVPEPFTDLRLQGKPSTLTSLSTCRSSRPTR